MVHQYDADKFLLRLMDLVALAHQNDSMAGKGRDGVNRV